ncbi:DUF3152 domain-containing protein [Streptomyces glomeratus]
MARPREAAARGRVPARPASPQGARPADGAPAQGVRRAAQGTAAVGAPRFADGTPAHGVPRFPADATPAHGTRPVRGDHPQQREPGGGWGDFGSGTGSTGAAQAAPTGRPVPRIPRQRTQSGPRQDYLDAFEQDASPRRVTENPADGPAATEGGAEPRRGSGRGRTFAGIAAAAVTTALAVVVALQVAGGHGGAAARSQSPTGQARDTHGSALGGDGTRPSASPSATPLTYEQAMGRTYPLGATLKGPGRFAAVPGFAKAPGTGRKYTYRVDVEQGLGLDGRLFAEAVQKTLNDDRSWAHHGARTFERVSSGKPDFVITLASPGTTASWCAKSGLDTSEDNVSCDSASTERVMINAYRWAQGSTTYGDKIHAYRQMLINHEVGHRLGYGHVTCDKDGELAPVMQQQTKFLDHDGIHCLPNPWPYPRS